MASGNSIYEADLLVIGGGPGGYHAAFRAASHGIQTTVVEASPALGGVCLQRGCIPSKTLLSLVETIRAAEASKKTGVEFGEPRLDVDAIRAWKNQVISKLAGGLDLLCKKHKVNRLSGLARFEGAQSVVVEGGDACRVKFRRAIVATGSRSIELRGLMLESPRVLTSRTALEIEDIPTSLLVIGGGYIGLELGQVYAGLGAKVTVVEMTPGLLPGVDRDLVRPLLKRLKEEFAEICLDTTVTGMKEVEGGIEVSFEGESQPDSRKFDKVLVAVGRRPNSSELELDSAGIEVNNRGFIKVTRNFRTACPNIFAIGDVIGNPMLAHKAQREGVVLADRLAGRSAVFKPLAIPAVVFTDPAIAWAGITESEAKDQDLGITIKKIPWSASGRAVTLGRTDGVTKLIFDKTTDRILGIGMTGPHVGEMISEGVLAIELGATARDIAKTIHPHPTLSETIGEAAGLIPPRRG